MRHGDGARTAALVVIAALAVSPSYGRVPAGQIHPGCFERVVAESLDSPVAMAIAPDGRVFVCEQGGRVRVVRRDRLLARPFLTVPTRALGEQGLVGIALDPAFRSSHRIYLAYTAVAPWPHQVIARCVAAGDTAGAGSLETVFEMDETRAQVHVGGALRFGPDGMLYAGTGDDDDGTRAQSLRSTFGKILRIDPDGGIPKDNPWAELTEGRYRAIWARGLRNAFAIDVDPANGRMFANDVGGSRFEEVNEIAPGGNYGWPLFEGPDDHGGFRPPLHAYGHDEGCAITGGAFYRPVVSRFPREWQGRYFYAEYCRSEIRWIDPAAPRRYHVWGSTRIEGPVGLAVARDGDLYYLARGNIRPAGGEHSAWGALVRVSSAASPRATPAPGTARP